MCNETLYCIRKELKHNICLDKKTLPQKFDVWNIKQEVLSGVKFYGSSS